MIARILRWSRAHRVPVLVASLVITVAASLALRRLTFDADVLHLLPRGGVAVPAFRTFLERFGSFDYLFIVFEAPSGHTIDDYEETVDAFVARLRQSPEIERVDAGPGESRREWSYVADRLFLLLGPKQLSEALARLDPAQLPTQLASTRELLSLPSPEMSALVRSDPLGLFLLVRDELAGASAGVKIDTSRGAYVTPDGRSRLVLARPTRPPFDTDFSKQLFARLRAIERETGSGRADPETPPATIRYAGGHRISIEIEGIVRSESVWNGVGSLAVILPLLYFAFRSPWLVAVGAVPSALAMLVVLAGYALGDRTLSAAATGAAAMQFGLGIDGVVLLFVAFRHLTSTGLDANTAATDGLEGSASSMLLGMWTTAATFYGLMLVDFPSLEELGRVIGHSMVLCGVLTLVLVPALLPAKPTRRTPLTTWWLARLVERHGTAVLVCTLIVTAALALAARRLHIDPSLDRLRANTTGTAFEQEVATRFGVPQEVYVVTASGPALEPLLEANEALVARLRRDAPTVAVQAPTGLLPSQRAQATAAAAVAAQALTPPIVSARLTRAAAEAGFKPGTFDPFVERLPRLLDARARLTWDGFVSHRLDDLLSRSVSRAGGAWTLATYVYPRTPAEIAAVRAIVSATPAMTLTGVPEVNRELGERFGPEFAKGVSAGTLLVLVLLLATFRRVGLTLLSLVPTIVALIWAGGFLALARIDLDLFSMFAVMTFVGIGVDYGIHMVHRFQHATRETAGEVIAHLGPVILVAGATTLLGFGTLVTSSYPPLRSLGLISIVMVLTLAVSSLLVLPALLMRRVR
jgi:predicted RND superfamily exporter protein